MEEVGGGSDGPETQENPEARQPELEPGDGTDPIGGGADQAAGETPGEVETDVPEQAEAPESEPRIDFEKFKDDILKNIDEKLKPVTEKPQREITEEEWAKHEEEWGVPRTTIDRVTRQSVQVFERAKEYIDSKLAALEGAQARANMSKEFPDINRLKAGMDEFLADFDPKHHNNPNLLRRAAIYARGLASQGDIKRVRTSDEKNRQVAGRIKTGTQEGSRTPSSAQKPLSSSQREAASMLPGGEAEYNKIKANKSRIIAV
jgi:hypothetical protein